MQLGIAAQVTNVAQRPLVSILCNEIIVLGNTDPSYDDKPCMRQTTDKEFVLECKALHL